jgi:hypothetical protein
VTFAQYLMLVHEVKWNLRQSLTFNFYRTAYFCCFGGWGFKINLIESLMVFSFIFAVNYQFLVSKYVS